MRTLTSTPGVDPATPDYPDGRVRDESGSIEGTSLQETLHGDLWQLLYLLMRDANLTPNGLPDNVTNGYQLAEALDDRISRKSIFRTQTSAVITPLMTGTQSDIYSMVTDASNDYDDLKISGTINLGQPDSGFGDTLIIRVYAGGAVIRTFNQTFTGGEKEIVSFVLSGIPYTAGQIVKVTGETGGNNVTVTEGTLITEGINN